jgi:tRNA-dihydrouridine synthase
VLANGNVTSVPKARAVLAETGAAGVMVGRSAIRNPWIFRQLREDTAGEEYFRPTLGDVRDYIEKLWAATLRPGSPPKRHIAYLKKFLNFVGQSVDPESRFLKAMRHTQTPEELFAVCDEHLLADGAAERPYAEEPYAGVIARPNHEAPATCADVTE